MSGVSKPTFDGKERRGFETAFGFDKDDRPVIRGNPIVFNSWSRVMTFETHPGQYIRFQERVSPDAVDRTLKSGSKVLAYWNHERGKVLGSTKNGTLRLRKAAESHMSMELYPTPEFLTTLEAGALKRGDVDQMSFGFNVVEDDWFDYQPDERGIFHREIKDMTYSEVSIVGEPAYEATSVQFSERADELRVYVEPKFVERFRAGMSIDFARKLHKTRLAG